MACRDEKQSLPQPRPGPCTYCVRSKIKCSVGLPGMACDICVASNNRPCSLVHPEHQTHTHKVLPPNPYGDGKGFERMIEASMRPRRPPPRPTVPMSLDLQYVLFWLALARRNRRAKQKQNKSQ